MQIFIRGKNPKLKKREVKHAAYWMASKLMSKRLLAGITLTIRFKKFKNDYCGYAIFVDNNYRPREFEIEINKEKSKAKQLRTLAHELTHIKQWAKGEMFDPALLTGHCRWHKKLYKLDETDYYDLPWEIEAHGREEGLYVRYKEALKRSR